MIKRHLSNILGQTTKRHLLAFLVDDYGAINTASKKALEQMAIRGYPINKSRFVQYDTLEDNSDIEILFDTLTSFKDINGQNVIWTPLAVAVNPDFEKIRQCGYEQYHYETLDKTLSRLDGYDKVYQYLKEGIEKGIYVPQFHGREHINIKMWMNSLRNGWRDAVIPFENDSLCVFRNDDGKSSSNIAFRFTDDAEFESFKEIISDGLDRFEDVYGYRATHFNAPGERESSKLNQTLLDGGIQYIETDKLKHEPLGGGRFRKVLHWNGQQNELKQRYIIRNCVFEPAVDMGFDWVERTFRQIEIAFQWHKPAVVSSHRVNFAGHISPQNRSKGIKALTALIACVQRKFPDTEFVSSKDLFNVMFEKREL